MHTKKTGPKTQWVAIELKIFTLQKQTPLLIHCTNPRPFNYIGLDNLPRNSGANLGIYMELGKHRATTTQM
jgi:hypothetical protein